MAEPEDITANYLMKVVLRRIPKLVRYSYFRPKDLGCGGFEKLGF
jgi:hypothetical protein